MQTEEETEFVGYADLRPKRKGPTLPRLHDRDIRQMAPRCHSAADRLQTRKTMSSKRPGFFENAGSQLKLSFFNLASVSANQSKNNKSKTRRNR